MSHVSMEVGRGESVALMGPSGSGKSTLLNLIAGLDWATSGTIRVGDLQVGTLSEADAGRFRRRQVGIIESDQGKSYTRALEQSCRDSH